ncbi:MAG: ComF family protein [Acidobacteria bacterium]|nr:ComF family protein [Acidobacteriota bacterium]
MHGTPICTVCRSGAFVFEQARSFGWYEGTLRSLIHLLKYDGFRPLAKPLGAWLGSLITEVERQRFDLIVPVPLHSKRQRQRGFNQSMLLAAHVSRAHGISLSARGCVRVRDTRPQTGLRAAERRKNVAGAFQVPGAESVKGRRVLLVDDVMTTGATANACARALIDAGTQAVWVTTLARVHPRSVDVI